MSVADAVQMKGLGLRLCALMYSVTQLIQTGIWAQMTPKERAVWPVLADAAGTPRRGKKPGLCWPGRSTIARQAGIAPTSVSAATALLEKRGLMRIVEKGGTSAGGVQKSNRYLMFHPVGAVTRLSNFTGSDAPTHPVNLSDPTQLNNLTETREMNPRREPGQKRAGSRPQGKGIMPGLTVKHLRDPELLRTFVLPKAQAAKLVNGSTADKLRLVRTVIHALKVGDDPVAMFLSNLKAKRDHGCGAHDDEANAVLRSWQEAGRVPAPVTPKMKTDEPIDDNAAKTALRAGFEKVRRASA